MTWTEACHKGRARWLMWIAICSVLACGFLIKGATLSGLLCALVIGVAIGTAVGFAVGPAAEKGAPIISGFFAGTPFYFIGISLFAVGSIEAREQHRNVLSDVIAIASIFLIIGTILSIAQALRVHRQNAARVE
jgi:hypothetical protein